jgi:NitT/TauT family transport system substrate-binding protein
MTGEDGVDTDINAPPMDVHANRRDEMANHASARWAKASLVTAFCWLSCVALDAPYSPAVAADQVKIGIARTISDAGYYIADAMGFFREDGLDVSITAFNSAAQMIAPLGTGELDVGGGTVSAGFYNAVGRGIGMKIVADQASIKPGYGYSSLMVRKDHVISGRYKTFADLKGMKVAIAAPGTGTASALNEALKKGRLKYGDVDVGLYRLPRTSAGLQKQGNRCQHHQRADHDARDRGWRCRARRRKRHHLSGPADRGDVLFISCRRDLAERFMRAYLRGVRMYNDALKDGRLAGPKADEVIAILVKHTTIKDESMFRRMVPSYCNPDGEVNVASLRKDLEFFRELGLIEKKAVSVDGVVDASFAKAAVAKLGPYRPPAN